MRTPSPSWCGLDRTHLWPTGSSLGDPLITARNFSSCPSDSISRWTPSPPETASGGFRSASAVSDFRLRARLDVSIPSTSPASEAFNPAFGYGAPHPNTGGTSTPLMPFCPPSCLRFRVDNRRLCSFQTIVGIRKFPIRKRPRARPNVGAIFFFETEVPGRGASDQG